MAILFISHDLAVVKNIADYICIMKDGNILEQNTKENIFNNPQHQYTKELIGLRNYKKEYKSFKQNTLLRIENLKVWYPIKKGILRRTTDHVKAIDSLNLTLLENHTLGIVGESGSGKTSLVLAILKLIKYEGKIFFNNQDISKLKNRKFIKIRKDIQMIFQDPFSSLSPRMTIQEIISEGLDVHESQLSVENKYLKIKEITQEVGLDFEDIHDRFPHEFSGGQRQRIAIARALILKPKLLILDEPTSALDVSIQKQIIELLDKLQSKYNMTYIFISHNLKVIQSTADYVIVLRKGQIIEEGKAKDVFNFPKDKYTKELLSSVI